MQETEDKCLTRYHSYFMNSKFIHLRIRDHSLYPLLITGEFRLYLLLPIFHSYEQFESSCSKASSTVPFCCLAPTDSSLIRHRTLNTPLLRLFNILHYYMKNVKISQDLSSRKYRNTSQIPHIFHHMLSIIFLSQS